MKRNISLSRNKNEGGRWGSRTPDLRTNRGGTLIASLSVVAVIAALVLVLSPVLREKIRGQIEPWTEWNSKQAVKDPLNFLNAAERKMTDDLHSIKAVRMDMTLNLVSLTDDQAEVQHQVQTGLDCIEELKRQFRDAHAATNWPVQWRGMQYDREALKRQILAVDGEVQRQQKRALRIERDLRNNRIEMRKAEEVMGTIYATQEEIKALRNRIQIRKIDSELKARVDRIRLLVDGLAERREELTGTLPLSVLAREELSERDTRRFETIMTEERSH